MKRFFLICVVLLFVACASNLSQNPYQEALDTLGLPDSISSNSGINIIIWNDSLNLYHHRQPPSGETWWYNKWVFDSTGTESTFVKSIDFKWKSVPFVAFSYVRPDLPGGSLEISEITLHPFDKYTILMFTVDGLTYGDRYNTRVEITIFGQKKDKQTFLWTCLPIVGSTRAIVVLTWIKKKDLKKYKSLVIVVRDGVADKMTEGVIEL